MTRENDPLKQTPACELDRDNRAMTREPTDDEPTELANYNQAMRVVRKLRAENERLTADNRQLENEIADMALGPTMVQNQRTEIERQREQLRVVLAHVEELRALLLTILQEDDPHTGVGAFFDDITAVLEKKP